MSYGLCLGYCFDNAQTSSDDAAPITHPLDMEGKLICGDAWGGIHTFEWTQESAALSDVPRSRQQCAFIQFRESSIACMEQLGGDSIAVSIQPNQNSGVLSSAVAFTATRPRDGRYCKSMGWPIITQ